MIHLPGPDGEVKAFPYSEVETRLRELKRKQRLRDAAFKEFIKSFLKVKE
jgi:hypothetical protein